MLAKVQGLGGKREYSIGVFYTGNVVMVCLMCPDGGLCCYKIY